MTITGSYPNDLEGQQDFLKLVNQTYKNLEAQSSVVSVHSTIEPTLDALLDQWSLAIPYAPPTNGSQLNWFNPDTGKIEQVYYPILGGTDVLSPYKEKSSNSGLEYIDEQVVGTAAALDISNIPATYKHLLITYSVRATGAGAATEVIGIRPNNNATATYAYIAQLMQSGSNPVLVTATAQTQGRAGFCPQGGSTDQAQAAAGIILIPNYSLLYTGFAVRPIISTCVGFAANARPYAKNAEKAFTSTPVSGIVNRIVLFPVTATTFQRGSKMIIWGLK